MKHDLRWFEEYAENADLLKPLTPAEWKELAALLRAVASRASCSCSAKSVYDAATAFWRASGVAAVAYGAPGLPGPSSESREWDEERAMLEGAIYTLREAHGYLYPPNNCIRDIGAVKPSPAAGRAEG